MVITTLEIAMSVQYVAIVQQESTMVQLAAMDVKDFLGEVLGRIIHIAAGK